MTLRRARAGDDDGSAPVEFLLTATLLTLLTLGILQLGIVMHVRTVLGDAAVHGAFAAALADVDEDEGRRRTIDIVRRSLGETYSSGAEVEVGRGESGDTVRVRIRATLPLAGLLGSPRTLEVTGHAPAETLG